MFQRQAEHTPITIEPQYQKKKNLYHVMIRRRERNALFSRMRKNAELPEEIEERLMRLPEGVGELIGEIVGRGVEEWEHAIAEFIVRRMRDRLGEILESATLAEVEVITLFNFLLSRGGQEEELYREYYELILKRSSSWSFPLRMQVFSIFNCMIKMGRSFVLQDATTFHSTLHSNRFFASQLHFYNLIVKKHPQLMAAFLPHATLKRLTEQLPAHFYSEQEKLTMLEVLIQVLYASQEREVSKCFNLGKVFHAAEYLIGYSKRNKMLIDRSILLVYNINIDATSQQFVKHNCFKVLEQQLKNSENPLKLRSLMAQLFLNSIYYYPQQTYSPFLSNNLDLIFTNLDYIIQQFYNVPQVSQFTLELLRLIFEFAVQETDSPVLSFIKGHPSFLKTLHLLPFSQPLLQDFNLKGQLLP